MYEAEFSEIKRVFIDALDIPHRSRLEFLERELEGDQAKVEVVLGVLEFHETEGGILETNVADLLDLDERMYRLVRK